MPLDPQKLINHAFPEIEQVLTPQTASLYALGVGLGDKPLDPASLSYIYEEGLEGHPFRAVPTQPVTMGFFRWVLNPELGVDFRRVVHGEERLTLHDSVPTEGRICSKLEITGVTDKGPGRGAVISTRRSIRLASQTKPFATVEGTLFCRGDGGCGSAGETTTLAGPAPEGTPDNEITYAIREDAALLYRLSGDYNPLHVDLDYARNADFDKPILHGLCTFGIAARVIWQDLDRSEALSRIGCRFSSPVLPGETLTVQVWKRAEAILFRALVGERVVLDRGEALIEQKG